MYRETRVRSIAKTISWRFWATVCTMVLVFSFTGQVKIALTIGGLEVILKMLLYFLHERVWDRTRLGRVEVKPAVLWFTGLPGAGKSTLVDKVFESLNRRSLKVEHLDSHAVRDLFPDTGFTREERDGHIKKVGYLASKLEKQGVFVLASFVSPYEETRQFVRNLCRNYIEIYVSTPLEVCERRDAKGLYQKARRGEIKNFTGISDPYEPPQYPELEINTGDLSLKDAASIVLKYLEKSMNGRSYRLSKVAPLGRNVKGCMIQEPCNVT